MSKIKNLKIVTNLQHAETVRATTLQLLDTCSQERLDRRPTGINWLTGEKSQWSLGEHLDHILLVEGYMRREIFERLITKAENGDKPFIRKTVTDINLSPAFLPKLLLKPAEKFFVLSNRISRVFVPRRVTEYLIRYATFPTSTPEPWVPTHGQPRSQLIEGLRESLSKYHEMFEKHPDAAYGEMTFEHTVIGRHSVPQLLRIVSIHEEWHQDRMKELL
mgnify:CR=1 FL=1